MTSEAFLGIDLGTSGARVAIIDGEERLLGQAVAPFSEDLGQRRDPRHWRDSVFAALRQALQAFEASRIRAIAVDGTSGTLLAVDRAGEPLAPALMYNDPVADGAILAAIGSNAPESSAAHGPTSGLAKLMVFQALRDVAGVLHQADWIAGCLTGVFGRSDENNALKAGYDPIVRHWPEWIGRTGANCELLPEVVPAGTPGPRVSSAIAGAFGLRASTIVVAGTTDGCASFLATGADAPGEGVSALGTTLTIKLMSDRPVFSARHGIYSHRMGQGWLAGGASNSGGGVLLQHFVPAKIEALSRHIDPASPSGLDYYPLPAKGERFPILDPDLAPRLAPRPSDDALFLKGLFEGMAGIEALAYRRLAELGAPALTSLRSVGGGARNPAWTSIRQARLGVPFVAPLSQDAAFGTARLALRGFKQAGPFW